MASTSPFAVKDTGGIAFKVDIIKDAYSQLRISGITTNPTPSDLETALIRLENMVAEWRQKISINYAFEDCPDPNTETNVKRSFWHCLATNLAVRLIPDFNKQVPQSLMNQAVQSYSSMVGSVAMDRINQVDYPNRMPMGSGNTLKYNRWQRFYKRSGDDANAANLIEMTKGDVNDFTEHFDSYLKDGEYIYEFTITTDDGLDVESSESSDTDVDYRIKATGRSESATDSIKQLTIVITTTNERVETIYRYFRITSSS